MGASGFGRELLQWVKDINDAAPQWEVVGFIDDNPHALEGIECDCQVIGTIQDFQPADDTWIACAIAIPHVKKMLVEKMLERGARFATIIHPSALVSDFVRLGEGCVLTPKSKISPNVKVGNYVSLLGSGLGHDSTVDDWATLSGNCSVNGHVVIGEGAYLGCNVCIAPSRKVGAWATCAMGSVVFTNVKPGTKVIGNPAHKYDL